MNTFILEWRPSISSYKMETFEQDLHYIDYGEFNWSVWDWSKAHSGDNFYMIKCGEGITGIVMKGFFTSEPYEADDWSGKNREVHYMDFRPTVMVHPQNPKGIITTQDLEEVLPLFQWNGGHSGRILGPEESKVLDSLWEDYMKRFSPEDDNCETLSLNHTPVAGIDDAVYFAVDKLFGLCDEKNEPQILHCLREGLAGSTQDEMVTGFLKDVIRFTDYNIGEMKEAGFSDKVLDSLLTK